MKAFLTFMIFTLTALTSLAQVQSDNSEHMTFKGVPIDGTLKEYVSKMEEKGFTHIETEDGVATFTGDFAAHKDCLIGVSTLKQKDLVSKVAVLFSEHDTWSSLSSSYFYLRELLTEKYGKPSESLEEFESSYTPEDDNSKMLALKMNRCKYYTIYEMDKGSIQLSIETDEIVGRVMLNYFDKINGEIIRAKAIDDL